MTPRKIVWITDPHLTESGVVSGVNCRARLERAVAQIERFHSDAIACVATGDLADTGAEAEYQALKAILSGLSMPLLPLIGNHDARPLFRATFPALGVAMPAFQQFRWDHGDLTLLCLDTHSAGEDGGRFDEARLAWVEEQLADCTDQRVLVFMHHPPGPLWLRKLDDMPLHDSVPLIDRLAAAPMVEHLFCGHVHRPVSGVIRGLPIATLRALAQQIKPSHEDWDWDDPVARDETPQYGIILVGDDRIVIQTNDLEESA